MVSQARLALAATYMIVHVLVACRYALMYCQMRHSLFVVTRGLDSLLLNLLASVGAVMACCLRQVAADTPPASPAAFSVPCRVMEIACMSMVALLFPTVMHRAVVLVVKFDPKLRERFISYVTARHRGKALFVWAALGVFFFLLPEVLDAECLVAGCDHPNCLMGNNLVALMPITLLQCVLMGVLAWRLSLVDLEQEGLGIINELYYHAVLCIFFLGPSTLINFLIQYRALVDTAAWDFVNTTLQLIALGLALYSSHILPSVRLGFVPEPLRTLLYGSRISPEHDHETAVRRGSRRTSEQALDLLNFSTNNHASLENGLQQNLLSAFTRPSGSDRSLPHSPTNQEDAPPLLLSHASRISPAPVSWDTQLAEWCGMQDMLQIHLNHPAFWELLRQGIVESPPGPSPHGSFTGSSKTINRLSLEPAGALTTTGGGSMETIRISTLKGPYCLEPWAVAAQADGPQDDAAETFALGGLLDAARSALQEEAVRFVLATLAMRMLDPKDKAHRSTICKRCKFLVAAHCDPRSPYRLDVSSEAEAAPLREVQKLARRAVLFADDVSSAMHSFDNAFNEVWPLVHELLVGYCISLDAGEPYRASRSQSGSGEGSNQEGGASVMDRLRGHRGTSDGGSAGQRGRSRSRSRSRSQSRSRSNSASSAGPGENSVYDLTGTLLMPFWGTNSGAAPPQQGGKRQSLEFTGGMARMWRLSSANNAAADDVDVARRNSRSHSLTRSDSPPPHTALSLVAGRGTAAPAQGEVAEGGKDQTHLQLWQRAEQGEGVEVEPLLTSPYQDASAAQVQVAQLPVPQSEQQLSTGQEPADIQGNVGSEDQSGQNSGHGGNTEAPSVEVDERKPSPPPVQAPPSVRRMSTGGIFTSIANPILTYTQRLVAEPPATTPAQPPARNVQSWQQDHTPTPTSNVKIGQDSDK